MTEVKTYEGKLTAEGIKVAIVAARFNSFMGEKLISGAIDCLVRHGGKEEDISVVMVPGALEIPLACKKLAESGKYDAVITVGVIVRGSTSHYDLVCNEYAKGVAQVMHDTGVPVTFGVITSENLEQAIERSGSKAGNKGVEAAMAAIEMVNVLKGLPL